MSAFRSGFVTIIGRPNVGKSTLLNAIIGEKLAIMSPKPQTTRHKIKGVYNDAESQIVFVDTPGIHKPKSKLGDFMVDAALSTINEVDVVVLVLDQSLTIGPGDEFLIDLIKNARAKTILVINKVDQLTPEQFAELYERFRALDFVDHVTGVSAIGGKGVGELVDTIKSFLPEGPVYYDPEHYTDQTERDLVAELIREKALQYLEDEIPHGIAIEIVKFKEREEKELVDIEANIIAEKQSHKGIIIGKEGRKLKGIGKAAREEIELLLAKKVNLQLWVKVREGWRDNPTLMGSYGYKK